MPTQSERIAVLEELVGALKAVTEQQAARIAVLEGAAIQPPPGPGATEVPTPTLPTYPIEPRRPARRSEASTGTGKTLIISDSNLRPHGRLFEKAPHVSIAARPGAGIGELGETLAGFDKAIYNKVVLCGGTNNMREEGPRTLTPEQIADKTIAIVKATESTDRNVVVIAIPPIRTAKESIRDKVRKSNEEIRKAVGDDKFIDTHDFFYYGTGELRTTLFRDAYHLTDQGYSAYFRFLSAQIGIDCPTLLSNPIPFTPREVPAHRRGGGAGTAAASGGGDFKAALLEFLKRH